MGLDPFQRFPPELVRFIDKMCADGTAGAREHYGHRPDKLKGSIKGFEEVAACRTKMELDDLLARAQLDRQQMMLEQADDYWFWRCREAEIEWSCQVLRCTAGLDFPLPTPTVGQAMMGQRVLEAIQGDARA